MKDDRIVLALRMENGALGIELTMVNAPAYLEAGRPEETKGRLPGTRAKLDTKTLLHKIFLCQDRLDDISRGESLRLPRNVAATRPFLVSSRPGGSRTFLRELA